MESNSKIPDMLDCKRNDEACSFTGGHLTTRKMILTLLLPGQPDIYLPLRGGHGAQQACPAFSWSWGEERLVTLGWINGAFWCKPPKQIRLQAVLWGASLTSGQWYLLDVKCWMLMSRNGGEGDAWLCNTLWHSLCFMKCAATTKICMLSRAGITLIWWENDYLSLKWYKFLICGASSHLLPWQSIAFEEDQHGEEEHCKLVDDW